MKKNFLFRWILVLGAVVLLLNVVVLLITWLQVDAVDEESWITTSMENINVVDIKK